MPGLGVEVTKPEARHVTSSAQVPGAVTVGAVLGFNPRERELDGGEAAPEFGALELVFECAVLVGVVGL